CWAVGYYANDTGTFQTLIEHWAGTSWAIVNSPNPVVLDSLLIDVACASASECWAVGFYNPTGALSQTLIERWDGTSWTIVTSPNVATATGSSVNRLTGVT